MPWKYYNPHPKGKEVADCVKRAICAVTGYDYMDVQRELNRIRHWFAETQPELPASYYVNYKCKYVCNQYAINHGWKRVDLTDDEHNFDPDIMTAERFCQEHPTGKYILQSKKHWAACVNGELWDTWDSTFRAISYYWVIEEGE